MPDEFKTTVVDEGETRMELAIEVDGVRVVVKVSGYGDNELAALKALYLLGQPERLAGLADEIERAAG